MYSPLRSALDKANARQSAVYLQTTANLLRSRAFATYYAEQTSRFGWATPAVFARLQKDLMFQVTQLIAHDTPDDQRWETVAQRCEQLALDVRNAFNITDISKKETEFRVPRGTAQSEAVSRVLMSYDGSIMPTDMSRAFYVLNALHSLRTYAQARHTLAHSTGNRTFENVLRQVDTHWLLSGYPHDLLAHDAQTVRDGVKIHEHLLHPEYCSTWMNVEGREPVTAAKNCRVFDYRKVSGSLAA